jgi:thioredoxin-dependent peroxiredoxin
MSLPTPVFVFLISVSLLAFTSVDNVVTAAEDPPKVGDEAKSFSLTTIDGDKVESAKLLKQGPVVLIVLRGYPGYQCPICNVQVGSFIGAAKKFAGKKAQLVLVYPGPAENLKDHAKAFIRGKSLPENVFFALDPDFDFTNDYNLRWDAKNETAYPSTFVISADGKVRFAKVSREHGGRATVDEVLQALDSAK